MEEQELNEQLRVILVKIVNDSRVLFYNEYPEDINYSNYILKIIELFKDYYKINNGINMPNKLTVEDKDRAIENLAFLVYLNVDMIDNIYYDKETKQISFELPEFLHNIVSNMKGFK